MGLAPWPFTTNSDGAAAPRQFRAPHDACGSFYVSLINDPDRTDKALGVALKELERVKADLKDDEVERVKNKIASSVIFSAEVPLGRVRGLGGQWMYNKEYRSWRSTCRR
jgi:predicted Zn-dependent peptidase